MGAPATPDRQTVSFRSCVRACIRAVDGRNEAVRGLEFLLLRPSILGPLWARSGLALGWLWARFGLARGPFWACSGLALRSLWARPGLALGSLWARSGRSLGSLWGSPLGSLLGSLWVSYLGWLLGSLWSQCSLVVFPVIYDCSFALFNYLQPHFFYFLFLLFDFA